MNYSIINEKTKYLSFIDNRTCVYNRDVELVIDKPIKSVIDESCCYYGSSYLGRIKGTKSLSDIVSKPPIIINERKLLVLFPLYSPRKKEAVWILYNNVKDYKKRDSGVEVEFNDGNIVEFDISFNIFQNQILKCSKLIAIYTLRN